MQKPQKLERLRECPFAGDSGYGQCQREYPGTRSCGQAGSERHDNGQQRSGERKEIAQPVQIQSVNLNLTPTEVPIKSF